jgi:hypothetical protein
VQAGIDSRHQPQQKTEHEPKPGYLAFTTSWEHLHSIHTACTMVCTRFILFFTWSVMFVCLPRHASPTSSGTQGSLILSHVDLLITCICTLLGSGHSYFEIRNMEIGPYVQIRKDMEIWICPDPKYGNINMARLTGSEIWKYDSQGVPLSGHSGHRVAAMWPL